jgi:hypothetical protein
MTLLGTPGRRLRAALQQAPDRAITRVVAMMDSLTHRGVADSLLADVRPRLRQLQLPRPIRLPRLLFLPLEGALVAPGDWRAREGQVPRSAIPPIALALRARLEPLIEELEAAALGHTTAEEALVASLGARLWPAAGATTLPAELPGWCEAGLPVEAAAPILALCGAVWRHAVALWQARDAVAGSAPSETVLHAALAPLAAEGPAPLVAGMVLLLRHAARPGLVATVAGSLSPSVNAVATQELAAMLLRDAAAVGAAATPAQMADAAALLHRRLEDVERSSGTAAREAWRAHGVAQRSGSGAACHACFVAALEDSLLAPAGRAAAGPRAEDAVVAALEAAARGLRRLASTGRRLGQEAAFDRTLRDALARLARLASGSGGLTRVELARLVEILAGPEAALPLLGP